MSDPLVLIVSASILHEVSWYPRLHPCLTLSFLAAVTAVQGYEGVMHAVVSGVGV